MEIARNSVLPASLLAAVVSALFILDVHQSETALAASLMLAALAAVAQMTAISRDHI